MPATRLNFLKPVNTSVQPGDNAYVSTVLYNDPSTSTGIADTPIHAGVILEVGSHYIIIDKDVSVDPVIQAGQHISFAKRIEANESGMKGYYADVTFKNYSNVKTELFAVSSEVSPSSK